MYGLLRPLLFRLDPERAHAVAMAYLRRVQASASWQARLARRNRPDPRLACHAFDLAFPGPLGMAAGFDKGAEAYNALLALGFSHVEVGTLTPRPQAGNPKPRIERHRGHRALVNRLGFNNPGIQAARERLQAHPPTGTVGVNVGRNKDTPVDGAVSDYTGAAAALGPLADYVTVNVSSPNTPGLRALQEPKALAGLIGSVLEALDDAGSPRPVLLKLHPDAPLDELVEAARSAVDAGAAGIIAVNTTTARPEGLEGAGEGGLSGAPLRERATEVVAGLDRGLDGEVPLVGVGGIETGSDVVERVRAGASLVQAYTGFVYRGPRFARLVHQEVLEELDRLGLDRLEELVGQAG